MSLICLFESFDLVGMEIFYCYRLLVMVEQIGYQIKVGVYCEVSGGIRSMCGDQVVQKLGRVDQFNQGDMVRRVVDFVGKVEVILWFRKFVVGFRGQVVLYMGKKYSI